MAAGNVVLAYSGGLDTSVAISWIKKETGKDVVAVCIDLGQGGEDLQLVRKRAFDCGAIEAVVIDAKDKFASEFCAPVIASNALYMNKYPLISAISRPLISRCLLEVAEKYNGDTLAHGCTGKGNDQVRFELSFNILNPDAKVIAPVRDYAWSRDKAIKFASENNLPIDVTHSSPFSIDQNVWGRAIEAGFLEDLWNAPIEEIYSYTSNPEEIEAKPDELVLSFEKGKPTAIDGVKKSILEIIQELNKRAGKQGVGRLDIVEDRLVGIKSREVYEAPAAMVLIAAHSALEDVTLERELARAKRILDQKWTNLVYEGMWFSTLKKALDSFISTSQETVSGDIRVKLYRGNIVITGRKSNYSLYDYNLATYGETDSFDQSSAKGFIHLFGLSAVIANKSYRTD